MCEDLKKKFLRNELFKLAFRDTVSHNHIYQNASGKEKVPFQQAIRDYIGAKIHQSEYTTIEGYIECVKGLSINISEKFKHILFLKTETDKYFRIGTSQKLFGMYLKYLWTSGDISEPPACPFDREILINQLKLPVEKTKWTEMDNIDTLKMWIERARQKALNGYNGSIAQWELANWTPENSLE